MNNRAIQILELQLKVGLVEHADKGQRVLFRYAVGTKFVDKFQLQFWKSYSYTHLLDMSFIFYLNSSLFLMKITEQSLLKREKSVTKIKNVQARDKNVIQWF